MRMRRGKAWGGVQLQSTTSRNFSGSARGVEFMSRTVKLRNATGPSGLTFVRSASESILPGSIQRKTAKAESKILASSSTKPNITPIKGKLNRSRSNVFEFRSPAHAKTNIYTKDAFKNSQCNSSMVSEIGIHNARLYYTNTRPFGGLMPLYTGEPTKFSHKVTINKAALRLRNSPGYNRPRRGAVSPTGIQPL